MPQFIKMGLGGTGYQGNKGKDLKNALKRKARRKVFPGYPIEEPFRSINEVRDYLSGDKIQCLLCGREMRRIGTHLGKIHGMTVDKYKAKYKIPWTYGLNCSESSELYSKAVRRRLNDGWIPPAKFGNQHKEMVNKARRECPFKNEIATQNLAEYLGVGMLPKYLTPSGEPETLEHRRLRLSTRRGSKAYKEKMRARPQCQPEVTAERFGKYWKGRKQSKEHIEKRFAKIRARTA